MAALFIPPHQKKMEHIFKHKLKLKLQLTIFTLIIRHFRIDMGTIIGQKFKKVAGFYEPFLKK